MPIVQINVCVYMAKVAGAIVGAITINVIYNMVQIGAGVPHTSVRDQLMYVKVPVSVVIIPYWVFPEENLFPKIPCSTRVKNHVVFEIDVELVGRGISEA